MRYLIAFFVAFVTLVTVPAWGQKSSPVRVQGYFRKDGTYVAPHYRSAPDGNVYNNWSTKGNVNPYTGKEGTRVPDINANTSQTLSNPPYTLEDAKRLYLGDDKLVGSGPFGFDMGMSLDHIADMVGINNIHKMEDFKYKTKSPRRPHRDFDDYHLTISMVFGLAEVSAFMPFIRTDEFGLDARNKFEEISKIIESKYGKAVLQHNTKIDKSQSWAVQFHSNKVYYFKEWIYPGNDAFRKNKISNISLMLSSSKAVGENVLIFLNYRFINWPAVEKEIDNHTKSGL